MEIILWRPVAARASLMAMPMAPAPPGAKSTRFKSPGASSVSFLARRIAGRLVYRRGQNGEADQLFHDGLDHLWIGKSDLVDAVAVKIEQRASLPIGNRGPAGTPAIRSSTGSKAIDAGNSVRLPPIAAAFPD